MKAYLAYSASYHGLLIQSGARILYTYPGYKDALPSWDVPQCSDLMIDSGGHQIGAATCQYPLFIHSYCSWLRHVFKRNSQISSYVALDTADEKETLNNYRIMLAEGLNPVPVWKDGWSHECVTEYCRRSEMVAIGGLIGKHLQPRQYYRQLHSQLAVEFPFNRFHMLGLGVTAEVFTDPKPYSVDFSTWVTPVRHGQYIALENGIIREKKLNFEDSCRVRFDPDYRSSLLKKCIATLMALENR